jgi:hypothetical protein
MATITIQPAQFEDLTLPYPFHVDSETGLIGRQDVWRGKVYAVIGFTDTPVPGTALTLWKDVAADPAKAIGKYVTTADDKGQWSLHTSPISSATRNES